MNAELQETALIEMNKATEDRQKNDPAEMSEGLQETALIEMKEATEGRQKIVREEMTERLLKIVLEGITAGLETTMWKTTGITMSLLMMRSMRTRMIPE